MKGGRTLEPTEVAMTVLIIDDDPDCRELIRRTVESSGLRALAPNSLPDVLHLIPNSDAVVCNGLGGRWRFVWVEACKHGKIFALFSGDDEQITTARNLGVPAYEKPYSILDLLREIGVLFSPPEPAGGATGEP